MEAYSEFLSRIELFEVPRLNLGKSYFKGRPSLADKIDGENKIKEFFGDTVVFDLCPAVKERLSEISDKLYGAAPHCFAERLLPETLHMTLHDLSNSPLYEDVAEEMEQNKVQIERLGSELPSYKIRMRTRCIFNMVNTSLVMGLVPADEGEHLKLMELYGFFERVKANPYPLTPHITLAYFTPNGFDREAAMLLEEKVSELNLLPVFDVELDTRMLSYQRFNSMNDYRSVLRFE